MLQGSKSAFASKTVWGGLLGLAASVGGLYGYAVAPADVASAEQAIVSITAGVGSVIAIIGRFTAKKTVR